MKEREQIISGTLENHQKKNRMIFEGYEEQETFT